MSGLLAQVTAVVVNYQTRELTRRAVETLLTHYPRLELIVIDNGSRDVSTTYVRELEDTIENVTTILNTRNRYHGPALDQGIRAAATDFVLTLDSDCEVRRGGFLEAMLPAFADPDVYALGELRYKNRFGYTHSYGESARPKQSNRIPYIHPYAMLLRRRSYLELHPFVHHGAPCLKNMRDAQRHGLVVADFRIADYVHHYLRGTSSDHGYGVRARARNVLEARANRLYGWFTGDPTVPIRVPLKKHDQDTT